VGDIQIFIAVLLISVALLNALANWWQVPYPIVFVLGGLALGLVPGSRRSSSATAAGSRPR